jgi:hypothetical protein
MKRPQRANVSHDDEIARLKCELSNARQDIIKVSPAPMAMKALLTRTYKQKTPDDWRVWRSKVIAAIANLAAPDPALSNRYEKRAACPLCNSRGKSNNQNGFRLPDGLEMHLRGSVKGRHCRVIAAAFENARQAVVNRDIAR